MRIAIVSFIADLGHVIPLLKIAKLLQRNAFNVIYIGPSETLEIASKMEIASISIGHVRPKNYLNAMNVISRSNRRIMWSFLLYNISFTVNHNERAIFNGLSKLSVVESHLRALNPDVIIGDDHFFEDALHWLAISLKKPMLINNSEGSFRKQLSKIILKKNLPYSRNKKLIVDQGYIIYKWLVSPFFMFCRASENNQVSIIKKNIQSFIEGKKSTILSISPGVSCLEEYYLTEKISECDTATTMGPLPMVSSDDLSVDFQIWLDSCGPIIYVCFGTMVQIGSSAASEIVDTANKLGYRILWSSPTNPFSDKLNDVWFKWGRWVPQFEILKHKNVKIFITHAGAGAVQEAIWLAVPMIAIPHVWDQFYNAIRIEQLGIGISIDKENISKAVIIAAIQAAAEKSNRLKDVSLVFRKYECSSKLLSMISSLVHP